MSVRGAAHALHTAKPALRSSAAHCAAASTSAAQSAHATSKEAASADGNRGAAQPDGQQHDAKDTPSAGASMPTPPPRKTQADLDAELRARLEARSGGGGEAGIQLEDGQPVAMKRGVRENMFRVI